MNAKKQEPKLSFSEAIEELESILREVEGEETDIDELADQLKKAAGLLELCRAKIRRAEVEVRQIVQNLEQEEAPEAEPETPAAADTDLEEDGPSQDEIF